jgi:hypothetical protein
VAAQVERDEAAALAERVGDDVEGGARLAQPVEQEERRRAAAPAQVAGEADGRRRR